MVLLAIAAFQLTGCTVGPKYQRPAAPVPPAYKEVGDWKPAQPNDQNLSGNWWEIFQDPQLNALELQVNVSNQNLKAAEAQYTQARAILRYQRADFFPTVTVDPTATRNKFSANRQPHSAQFNGISFTDYKFLSNCLTSSTFGDAYAAPSNPIAHRRKPAQPTWQP